MPPPDFLCNGGVLQCSVPISPRSASAPRCTVSAREWLLPTAARSWPVAAPRAEQSSLRNLTRLHRSTHTFGVNGSSSVRPICLCNEISTVTRRWAFMQFSSSLKFNHIFRRLYRKGQSAANGYLVLYCRKNGSRMHLPESGITITTDRRRQHISVFKRIEQTSHQSIAGLICVVAGNGRCCTGTYVMESQYVAR